jgi:1,4-dihydroxy-2-naphthoate octaprenyltransferase
VLSLVVLVAALLAHISVNTLNEYFDFTSGLDVLTDRTPFSGGSGGLVECPEAKGAVLVVGIVSLLGTIALGLYLVMLKGLLLLCVGIAGVVIILAYTRGINKSPLLGLVSSGFAFGPLFIFGTYFSLAESSSIDVGKFMSLLLNSAVPFFLVSNLSLVNHLPDVEADRQVGRNTFPIVFGRENARRAYLLFLTLCAAAIVVGVFSGSSTAHTLVALLPLLPGLRVHKGIGDAKFQVEAMIPYMGQNVAVALITPLMLALAIFFSSWAT